MTSAGRRAGRYARRQHKRRKNKQALVATINSFEKVFMFFWFMACSIRCCRGVRWKASVQRFELHCLTHSYKTKRRIKNKQWKPKRASHFLLFDAGKLRQIDSVNIHTRAVQCTICVRCIMLIAERISISDNFASRPGKGTQAAIKSFSKAIQEAAAHGTFTIWMFDFSSFFASIFHEPVKEVLYSYFDDEYLVYIVEQIFCLFGDRGFQLGSHFSQSAAILMGAAIDNYIKCQTHIGWYGRYSDDGFLICNDTEKLERAVAAFEEVSKPFGLTLNKRKAKYIPDTKTAIFLKKRFSWNGNRTVIRLIRKSAKKTRQRIKKLFKKCDAGLIPIEHVLLSYNAWTSYAAPYDSFRTRIAMLQYIEEKLDERSISYAVKRNYLLELQRNE